MQYTFIYLQNATLQAQVSQLQEDIAKDTELRQELFDKLKHAKADLTQELSKLDRCLKVRYRLTLSLKILPLSIHIYCKINLNTRT